MALYVSLQYQARIFKTYHLNILEPKYVDSRKRTFVYCEKLFSKRILTSYLYPTLRFPLLASK